MIGKWGFSQLPFYLGIIPIFANNNYTLTFRRFTGGSLAFLTVWGGQTEREAAFLNIKLHAARFRVCVGLLADRRITAAVCKQTLFQGGVVGADMDKGVFLRITWNSGC